MTLRQLSGLSVFDEEPTDPACGAPHDGRPVASLLGRGLVLLDKPPGPTSHEVVAWTRRMLGAEKAGHSGTLDPQVSGVLPLGLGEATKALGVLLLGSKEYVGLCRFHAAPRDDDLARVVSEFTGPIHQKPPQRSAVARQTRTRTVHAMEALERRDGLVLIRVECESGTYVRKLFYDMGEVLGPGASMVELRRTRVDAFPESAGLTTMHELKDAHARWSESGEEAPLRRAVRPVEEALGGIGAAVMRDSAVDAVCHGAQLAVPGVLAATRGMARGDPVALYTQKGEAVALAEAAMSEREIAEAARGHAFSTRRILMEPGTYPRGWRNRRPEGGGGGGGP